MVRTRLTPAGVAAVALLCSICVASSSMAQEELVDNPQYASWSKHQPDTTVSMKMVTNMAGQTMNMDILQTLKEVTPDKAVVEVKTTMDMMGQKQDMPAQTVDIKAKVTKAEADKANLPQGADGESKDLANETITVAGKDYDCKVTEFSGEQNGMKTKGKVWRCDLVPGGVVKVDMTMEGAQSGDMKMELVSVETK
jgi:hypothetical protein